MLPPIAFCIELPTLIFVIIPADNRKYCFHLSVCLAGRRQSFDLFVMMSRDGHVVSANSYERFSQRSFCSGQWRLFGNLATIVLFGWEQCWWTRLFNVFGQQAVV